MLLSGKFLPAMNWILTENTAQTTALSSEKKCFRRRITQWHHFNKLFVKPGVFSVETTLWLCILLFFYIIQLELKTFADVYFSGPLVLLDEPFSPHPLCLHRALVKPLCQSKQLQVLAHACLFVCLSLKGCICCTFQSPHTECFEFYSHLKKLIREDFFSQFKYKKLKKTRHQDSVRSAWPTLVWQHMQTTLSLDLNLHLNLCCTHLFWGENM